MSINAKSNKTFFKRVEPFLYLLPAFILFISFTYYPFVKTIYNSFHIVDSMGNIKRFIGFENYLRVLQNKNFLKAIVNTIMFVIMSVPVSIFIALMLALAANQKRKISPIYETMFSLPMAMSMSVSAMIFQLIYNPTIGALNYILQTNIHWLTDKKHALIALIIIQAWMTLGYNFLFLLAGLRGVPPELIESADIEGASGYHKVTKIILPMISPTLFFLLCSALAKGMMMSGLTLILTQGGPQGSTETIISFMYRQAVNNHNYNDAYTAAIIGFVITFGLVLLGFKFEKKGVHYS